MSAVSYTHLDVYKRQIRGAADDDFNSVMCEELLGARTHAAGEDDIRALLMEPFGQHARLMGRGLG